MKSESRGTRAGRLDGNVVALLGLMDSASDRFIKRPDLTEDDRADYTREFERIVKAEWDARRGGRR